MAPDELERRPIRASDAEREATIERLRDSAAEGRIALEELADRIEAAFGATHSTELEELVADLPAAPPASSQPERAPHRRFFGVLGGDTLRGPMRLAGSCTLVNFMGGVDLDLSEARIEGGQLSLRIISIMGGSTVHVPNGVHIDRSGISLLGGDNVAESDELPPAEAPVVRIRVFNLMGGNDIRRSTSPPSRWPWQRRGAPLPPPEPPSPAP